MSPRHPVRPIPRLESLESRTLLNGGGIDPTFGKDGVVTSTPPNGGLGGFAEAVAQDGSIFVADAEGLNINDPATGGFIPHEQIVIYHYNPDGSPDAAFGDGGRRATDFGMTYKQVFAMTLLPDGKIVVVGREEKPGEMFNRFILDCFNADGSLDAKFGTGGEVQTPIGNSFFQRENVSLAGTPDGHILVGGCGDLTNTFTVACYNPDGSPDQSFFGNPDSSYGGPGLAITDVSGPTVQTALLVQPDGKVVAGGYVGTWEGGPGMVLTRYNADGRLDPTFGRGGVETFWVADGGTYPTSTSSMYGLALQGDGKIVAVGEYASNSHTTSNFLVVRFNADGTPDVGFGDAGVVKTPFDSGWSVASRAFVQPDGKILVAGKLILAQGGSPFQYALARYNPDGSPDASFGTGGAVQFDLGEQGGNLADAALQPDGKLVVLAGYPGVWFSNKFSLIRHLPADPPTPPDGGGSPGAGGTPGGGGLPGGQGSSRGGQSIVGPTDRGQTGGGPAIHPTPATSPPTPDLPAPHADTLPLVPISFQSTAVNPWDVETVVLPRAVTIPTPQPPEGTSAPSLPATTFPSATDRLTDGVGAADDTPPEKPLGGGPAGTLDSRSLPENVPQSFGEFAGTPGDETEPFDAGPFPSRDALFARLVRAGYTGNASPFAEEGDTADYPARPNGVRWGWLAAGALVGWGAVPRARRDGTRKRC